MTNPDRIWPISRRLPIIGLSVFALLFCAASAGWARGVTPYLPLNTSPEIERQIERVLILAGRPVVRRPIPAALVLDALPDACKVDKTLCEQVRRYLQRFQKTAGVTQLQADLAVTLGDSDRAIPNAHGRTSQSAWQVVGGAYYQPSDYLLLNVGGMAYQGRATPTGSVLSAGFDFLQLDVGFRDHWFSPMATSSMLIGTEAPTMPSVTLSNYQPLTPLGFTYEVFAAQMSRQDGIDYFDTTTSGYPRLSGIQLGIEPVAGYALTVNRLMQYGGGARGGTGFSDLLHSFYQNNTGGGNSPDDAATGHLEFGNSLAGVTGTMQFPGRVPFSISMEYAGDDGSYGGNYRLGDSAFSVGVDFPLLWQRFDFKYEATEWQNVWYTHHLYPDGLTNDNAVLGHWFGDQRQFGDQVGGHSHVVQLGAHMDDGSYWRATYRNLAFVSSITFQSLPAVPYRHLNELGLQYSRDFRGKRVGVELVAGSDAFGEKYGRLAASLDWLPTGHPSYSADTGANTSDSGDGYKLFADLGVNYSRVFPRVVPGQPSGWERQPADGHIGFGVRRSVSERSDLGVRLELDRVDHRKLLSFRALDYRYKLWSHAAVSVFAGAGRYSDGAPAYGWYYGYGVGWLKAASTKWDVNIDWRTYDKLSRNRVLSDDPPGTVALPRIHYDIDGMAIYLSRSF